MKRALRRPRVAILGCGHVGRALACALVGAGPRPERVSFRGEVVVWSRSRASVRRCLEEATGSKRAALKRWRNTDKRPARPVEAATSVHEAVEDADVVLLSVKEEALRDVIGQARPALRRRSKPVLLLTSGFQDLAPLRRALDERASLGRFHPLAPFPDGESLVDHTHFGIEGDARALRTARALLRQLGGLELELRVGRAVRYHAGAALFGGGLVALFALAQSVMRPAVRSPRALRSALYYFAGLNMLYAAGGGPRKALTGPLARGSEATVRLHLRELRAVPEARAAYCQLGRTMLALARARGSIDAPTERRLRRLLSAPRRGR